MENYLTLLKEGVRKIGIFIKQKINGQDLIPGDILDIIRRNCCNDYMSDPNNTYIKQFNKEKYNLAYINDTEHTIIDTYPCKINTKKKSYNESFMLEILNHALLKLNVDSNTKGLCSLLSNITLEAFSILCDEPISFITVGRIINSNGKNIFKVPEKNTVISIMKKDQQEKGVSSSGGNLHVWITLGNGLIIDPSILLTIANTKKVLYGFPNELISQFTYEPYTVSEIKDFSELKEDLRAYIDDGHELMLLKGMIDKKYNQVAISKTKIDGYYA